MDREKLVAFSPFLCAELSVSKFLKKLFAGRQIAGREQVSPEQSADEHKAPGHENGRL